MVLEMLLALLIIWSLFTIGYLMIKYLEPSRGCTNRTYDYKTITDFPVFTIKKTKISYKDDENKDKGSDNNG